MKEFEEFDDYNLDNLIKEVASTEIVTKLAYILDLFPKFRSAFLQKLKLTPKNKSVVTNAINIIGNCKISKVYCKVKGHEAEIFLDSCASFNMITRAALDKFNISKQPIGKIKKRIFQAYSNTTSTAEIYELEINIGKIIFKDLFKIVEKNDIFDILIGVDSLKKHKLNLNFIDDTLYTVDQNNNPIKLTEIQYNVCLNRYEDGYSKEHDDANLGEPVIVTVSLMTANQEINTKKARVDKIIELVPELVKNTVLKLFGQFESIIADKTDDLKETKLYPHRIELKIGITPIKQKAYRLSKVQVDALKVELTKLINDKLIVPSQSSWFSPVVLVMKKNGQYRMCVDYRKLNNLTIKDSYALPLIDDILCYV